MPTEHKIAQVADLEDRLNRCVIAIGVDFRGLNVGQMRDLRTTLRDREPSTELRVVKNNLLKLAAANAGKAELAQVVEEATAFLFGYGEVVNPPKALAQFLSESQLELTIRGGYLDGAILSADEIMELSKLPGRIELLGQVADGLMNPIRGLAGTLSSAFRELAAGVAARADQLEAAEPAPLPTNHNADHKN